ncbi:MAG: flippase-like domain-containing protein [Gemmatimonadota bacterium]|nr:MAG: flippase-like domain-containing protein [Gemmatimonadota bacterium]
MTLRWRKYLVVAKIILTFLILGIVLLQVDIHRIGSAFQSLRVSFFILALLFVPVNLIFQLIRWHYILKTVAIAVTPRHAFKSILAGLAFSLVTPGRVGEVGRSLYFQSSTTIKTAGLVILEKAYAFIVILIVSGISIMLWQRTLIGALIIVSALFIGFQLKLIRSLLSRLSFLFPYGEKIAELWSSWDSFERKHIALLLAISMGFFVIVFLQFFILVSSFQTVSPASALIAIPLTMAINSFPITIAGLGLREGAAVFFFSKFGVAEAAALNGAFLLFVIDILIPGLVGLPLISKMRLHFEHAAEEKPFP